MNKYIKVELTRKNEFRCDGSFELFGIVLDKLNFKIDTGCPLTSIPLKKTPLNYSALSYYRDIDYNDVNVQKQISFGVNDSFEKRKRDKEKFYKGLYDELDSITCIKKVENFTVGGCNFGNIDIKVSYIRDGNILIGMDILRKCDIHISKSIKTGKNTMLACPLDQINDSYIQALINEFGIGEEIKNSLIHKIDYEAIVSAELNSRL